MNCYQVYSLAPTLSTNWFKSQFYEFLLDDLVDDVSAFDFSELYFVESGSALVGGLNVHWVIIKWY